MDAIPHCDDSVRGINVRPLGTPAGMATRFALYGAALAFSVFTGGGGGVRRTSEGGKR